MNPLYAPTASYVSDDRSRLLLRLDMYGLQERQVQGDGNCQVCVRQRQESWQELQLHAAPPQSVLSSTARRRGGLH